MTEKFELYKCSICGNLVEVMLTGAGELVCCGQKMELLKIQNAQNDEQLTEKHSPVIWHNNGISEIRTGPHPMIPEHYIMFTECFSEDKNEAQIKYFYPNDNPIMQTNIKDKHLSAISYCNIHGLYDDTKKKEE